MIFIKEHFDKILEAYDNDYEGMNNAWGSQKNPNVFSEQLSRICLLYTSDAADE